MSRPRIRLRREAEADLAEAMAWYEERRAGLGVELLRSVERVLESIREYPLAAADLHRGVRRVKTRRFQYFVYYVVENDDLTVIAVLHQARDPRTWMGRLGDST